MDSDTRKFIKMEIAKALNSILTAEVGSSESVETESIKNLFPGMDQTQERPVTHPFGMASRAVEGILSVSARSGEHVGNRIILGHRDKNRPSDLERGEMVIYSNGGLKLYMRNGRIQVGSENAENPAVLFNELKTLLESILDHIINHQHIGNAGYLTEKPFNAAEFETDKENIDTIKSEKTFLEK